MARPKSIVLVHKIPEGFEVLQGGLSSGPLTWDEMLGQVAELTHPKLGIAHYPMKTSREWKALNKKWSTL